MQEAGSALLFGSPTPIPPEPIPLSYPVKVWEPTLSSAVASEEVGQLSSFLTLGTVLLPSGPAPLFRGRMQGLLS